MLFLRPSLLVPIALVATLSAAPARAQAADATLSGVVRDAENAPIAGVIVMATNEATKASQTATTGADGSYSFRLPPGSYSVKASAFGFWGEALSVDVAATGPSRLDMTLTPTLGEVVTVTAMKRETAPIDVPFSVAALSEHELRERGAENIEGVAANVVGLTVQSLGPGQSQVAIRGVSAGQIARDQPGVKEQVGVYLDESAVSFSLYTPDLDLIDVNRVEVLRGPQGTLFGAGSVTGTIRYVTNQPTLGTTDGFVELGGGLVDGGSETASVKAGVNVPLGDKAALRYAGYYTLLPGWTDSVQPDLSVQEDTNDGYRTGGRLALMFAPTDNLTITPRVVFQRVIANGWNREDIYNLLGNPFTTSRPAVNLEDRQEFTQLDEDLTDDFWLGDITLRYEFSDHLALTSITSYLDRDIFVVRDTTALTASFTGGTQGAPEFVYTLDSPLYDTSKWEMWAQELRLSGDADRLKWLVGAFYSSAERDYGQDVSVPGIGAPPGVLAPVDSLYFSDLSYQLDQFALFGEATWSLTSRFDLTGGVRYYNFSEDKEALVDGVINNPPPALGVSVLSTPGSTDSDGFAPRLIASFKASDDHIFNAQVSRGFRLGGINDPLNTALCSGSDLATFGGHESWEDETVWNYEVGYKSNLMGGRGSLNASLFYIDIDDLQTTVTAGTCTSRVVFNVPQAHSQGAEVEFALAPTTHFDFAISASFNDSELDSTLTSTDNLGNVTIVSGIEEGRRLPTVPQLQAAASATYWWEVMSRAQLYLTGVYQHVGSRFTQVGDEDLGTLDLTPSPAMPNTIGGPLTATTFTYDPELPAYDIINLRLGLRRDKWDVAVYVNNVTDELALLSLDRERGTLARIGYVTNQPRTYGLWGRYNF